MKCQAHDAGLEPLDRNCTPTYDLCDGNTHYGSYTFTFHVRDIEEPVILELCHKCGPRLAENLLSGVNTLALVYTRVSISINTDDYYSHSTKENDE